MERPSLELRLTALGDSVGDRLSIDQTAWLSEFVRAGEYSLALEMIADSLSEAGASVQPAERAEAETLSAAMGNHDRVMGPLALCPD